MIRTDRRQGKEVLQADLFRNLFLEKEVGRWMLRPNSTFRVVWDICSLLLIFYTCIAVPFQLCVYEFSDDPDLYGIFLVDYVMVLFFSLDVLVIARPDVRASHYWRGRVAA